MNHKNCVLALGLIGLTTVSGLQAQTVSMEDYRRAEQFLRSNVSDLVFRADVDPEWAEDAPLFWYQVDTRRGSEFFLVNAEEATKRPFFDQQKLAENLSEAMDREIDPYDLPFRNLEWDHSGNSFTFQEDDTTWEVDMGTLEVTRVKEDDDRDWRSRRLVSESPDGKWVVTRKDYNLWLKSNENGKEYQLTTDGKKEFLYGASLPWAWRKQEGPAGKEREPLRLNVSWSEDSKKLFANKLDLRKARVLYLLQSVPEKGFRPKSFSYYRALTGEDSVATLEPYIFDIVKQTKTRIDIPAYDDLIGGNWDWYGDGSNKLYTILRERGYGSATLLEADAATGKVRTVFKETSKTYVDPGKSESEYLPETDEFLWLSERDGWNHIYLYDVNTGKVKHQVTSGAYVVDDIEYIDKENRKIYFIAGGREPNRDPYYEHLYVVNFDGSGLKLLTPGNATHGLTFSPDHKYFVDSYSRVDLKPKTVLRKTSDESIVMELEQADIKDLLATGWQYPEPFNVKARDGKTDIYGVIFRPSNFDPDKKYPIIDGTYSGPQAVRTPKSFGGGYRNSDQPLAELGFIVVTVDGLGTAGRSKAFQDYSWKNLGDTGSEDHIKAIRELAQKYPYMDTSRVGIYGHSAGGYDAARAILKHPGFYKVAVSSSGNHDLRVSKAWWPELYMDYPAGPVYEKQSNINLAENLEGNLLLVHGDMDDNVHPSATLRMADALIKAGKSFDMLIMPNKSHGLGGSDNYFEIKRWNYFVEHLMGAEPILHYQPQLK